MSTLLEIEAAIPRLAPEEVVELRAWLEEFCEEQLDLTEELKAELDEAQQDIAAGRFRTRQAA